MKRSKRADHTSSYNRRDADGALDEIVRQKDPALKEAVEQLARGDVFGAIDNLDQQGRVHEIVGRQERLTEIAREYAREPKGTLVISPDNESRRELNSLIHREMQDRGDVSKDEHKLRVLDSRQEMTGADRQWAGQYETVTWCDTRAVAKCWASSRVNTRALRRWTRKRTGSPSTARTGTSDL